MLFQVGQALFQCLHILLGEVCLGDAAVILEGTDGGYQHHSRRCQPRHAALDVHELFSTQVGAEACLGDAVVCQLQGQLGGTHRVAAVGDVGKGTAVHQGRGVLQGLDQVGLDGVLEQGSHRTFSLEIPAVDRISGIGIGHQNIAQTLLEVGQVRSQAEDRHHLTGYGDLEAIFSGGAVCLAAQTDDGVAQGTVVHIQAALEENTAGVDAQYIALLDMVVDEGAEQVVGGGDGMHIAGEVEVDVLHGDNLGIAAAGSTALDAEYRAERGLTQGDDSLLADAGHRLTQTYGGGSFALTGGSGVDGGNQDQFAVFPVSQTLVDAFGKLGLIASLGLQFFGKHTVRLRDLVDGQHLGCGSDFNVTEHDFV